MASSEQISNWLHHLKAGDEDAAEQLWQHCWVRVVRYAHQRLADVPLRSFDEEDVALSAMKSFMLAARKGRFPDLHDQDGLWKLLHKLTHRKAVDLIRRKLRLKAGAGKVRGESALALDSAQNAFENIAGDDVSPELSVLIADEIEHLLQHLPDDSLRAVAVGRLSGLTAREIAEQIGRSPRSVERKLAIIRDLWELKVT